VVATVVVVIQIAAVVAFGAATIFRYPLWSVVDEGAHFANIQYIAEHGSYPVLGKTLASDQVLAIAQHRYPKHTTVDARTAGLGGLAYEALQPPLYYYVAAPVFFLSGNYHTKAILLRLFGLLLLVISIALLARLSRRVLKGRWLVGMAAGMLVLLMPGIVVRMVTISNINLAIPLCILAVTELWIAWEEKSAKRLVLCGFLVGCGVLTDLYLLALVPVFVLVALAVVWPDRNRQNVLYAVGGAAVGLVIVLPWLVFNETKYHALTAGKLAERLQTPIVNPTHMHFTVGQLPGQTVQFLFQPLMPQEWGTLVANHLLFNYGITIFEVLLTPLALVMAVALGRRLVSTGYWILILPWACNILLLWYIDVGEQWAVMVPRYVYPSLPMLALFSVAAVLVMFRAVRPILITTAVSTLFLLVLWIHLLPNIGGVGSV